MIIRFYNVYCDLCDNLLCSYPFSPTATQLRKDGVIVKFQNGKMKIVCG